MQKESVVMTWQEGERTGRVKVEGRPLNRQQPVERGQNRVVAESGSLFLKSTQILRNLLF